MLSHIHAYYIQPGAAYGMQYRDSSKWTKGFGVKNKETPDVPPDPDTIFRIGSVSKVFAVSFSLYKYSIFTYIRKYICIASYNVISDKLNSPMYVLFELKVSSCDLLSLLYCYLKKIVDYIIHILFKTHSYLVK